MTFWQMIRAANEERHKDALNYSDMEAERAWVHELQRGAPSGGVAYPVGWWGMGSEHQPNAEWRYLPPDLWAPVYHAISDGQQWDAYLPTSEVAHWYLIRDRILRARDRLRRLLP